MYIYEIWRTGNVGYEEDYAHVIVAKSRIECRKLARIESSDTMWNSKTVGFTCHGKYTGKKKKGFVILTATRG